MSLHPIEDLSASLHSAIIRDLPVITFKQEDWDAWNRLSPAERSARNAKIKRGDRNMMPMKIQRRRPYKDEIRATLFLQKWPSRSLGFVLKNDIDPDGVEAYTVVIECNGVHAVYFGSRLAYFVSSLKGNEQRKDLAWKRFLQNIAEQRLVGCEEAAHAYHATNINRFGSSTPRVENAVEPE
jgi:hypothetical protein